MWFPFFETNILLMLSDGLLRFQLSCFRTLADPSFQHKMAFEFMATFFSSVLWEMSIRKERCVLHYRRLIQI